MNQPSKMTGKVYSQLELEQQRGLLEGRRPRASSGPLQPGRPAERASSAPLSLQSGG